MKIKKVQSVCLILACVVATGLIGCGKTDETPKKHEAITFMAPYLDIDSFIEEIHKTDPEIELEVVPYSGANTTTYLPVSDTHLGLFNRRKGSQSLQYHGNYFYE